MINIIEFEKRSIVGPVMKSDQFDLTLAKKVRELVKKYDIKFNPNEIVVDDDTADKVFQAGLELLAEVGLYNVDTQRVIQYTREELEQVAFEYCEKPGQRTFGQGKDKHTVKYRTSQDSWAPYNWTCPAGVVKEEWFIPYIIASAQEETVHGLGIPGGIGSVGGIVPKAGCPSEIICGIWEQKATREALSKAGRPGMHLGLIPTVSTAAATVAVLDSGLREPYNTMIGIHIIPEQRIDWTRLNLACICEERGIEPWTSAMTMLGGLCGGPEGTAVGMIANYLGQLTYGHGQTGSIVVNDMTGRASHREAQWAASASCRAVERNIKTVVSTCPMDSAPVFSFEELFLRYAIMGINFTASGMGYSWGSGNFGIVGRFYYAVMNAVAGMSRDKVNPILDKLQDMVSELVAAGGNQISFNDRSFPFVYDVEKIQPKSEYLDVIKRTLDKLVGVGVPISDKIAF
ncbi:monomethylamine:corrinoid methyltransferase [Phosphitispora sp. TUW77]|uniref:monomethylamine:corrinoid methyltransferase n=1 Tax=Phosphitispora sp. TUW77 TaxID=3152361 RepID=UPI003AB5A212